MKTKTSPKPRILGLPTTDELVAKLMAAFAELLKTHQVKIIVEKR